MTRALEMLEKLEKRCAPDYPNEPVICNRGDFDSIISALRLQVEAMGEVTKAAVEYVKAETPFEAGKIFDTLSSAVQQYERIQGGKP